MSTPVMPTVRAKFVRPEEGQRLEAFGDTAIIKLATEDTGGAIGAAISIVEPGQGPPLHRHGREDELFYILEGQASIFYDGAWTEVGPGSIAYLPRGQAHTFKNKGVVTVKMLVITLPTGFERFFAGCAEVFAAGSPPDMAKILALAAEHQIEFLPEAAAAGGG